MIYSKIKQLYNTNEKTESEGKKEQVTRKEFEQLVQEVLQLKQKVNTLEQENQKLIKEKNLLKQENIEFQRIQNIFQNEIEDMRLKNFNINTKFTIIGIQNNWYEQSSSEYKEYSLEQIKMYNQKYHFNVSQFQNPIFKIEEKTRTTKIDEIKNYLLKNPDRYLTAQDIMNMFHVVKITANRYIKEVLKQDSNNYKMIRVTVLREHKNGNKQKKWVNAITHIVSNE